MIGRAATTSATRVVVVEDEPLIRMDLVELLAEAGFVVVGASGDAETGLSLVREHDPDVVLLDITMPRRHGEDPDPSAGVNAAREIAGVSDAAVVMVTAHAQAQIAAAAAEAGALGYLVKPVSAPELMATITVAVNQRRLLHEAKNQAATLQSRMEARETVSKAVDVVRAAMGWDEQQAYAWLRSAAMDQRVTLTEAALAVLADPPTSV